MSPESNQDRRPEEGWWCGGAPVQAAGSRAAEPEAGVRGPEDMGENPGRPLPFLSSGGRFLFLFLFCLRLLRLDDRHVVVAVVLGDEADGGPVAAVIVGVPDEYEQAHPEERVARPHVITRGSHQRRPPLKPTCLRWLVRRVRGQGEVSRANSSQQKTGTSRPCSMRRCSSAARPSISSLRASRSPSSSAPPWNTPSHSRTRSSALPQTTADSHWRGTRADRKRLHLEPITGQRWVRPITEPGLVRLHRQVFKTFDLLGSDRVHRVEPPKTQTGPLEGHVADETHRVPEEIHVSSESLAGVPRLVSQLGLLGEQPLAEEALGALQLLKQLSTHSIHTRGQSTRGQSTRNTGTCVHWNQDHWNQGGYRGNVVVMEPGGGLGGLGEDLEEGGPQGADSRSTGGATLQLPSALRAETRRAAAVWGGSVEGCSSSSFSPPTWASGVSKETLSSAITCTASSFSPPPPNHGWFYINHFPVLVLQKGEEFFRVLVLQRGEGFLRVPVVLQRGEGFLRVPVVLRRGEEFLRVPVVLQRVDEFLRFLVLQKGEEFFRVLVLQRGEGFLRVPVVLQRGEVFLRVLVVLQRGEVFLRVLVVLQRGEVFLRVLVVLQRGEGFFQVFLHRLLWDLLLGFSELRQDPGAGPVARRGWAPGDLRDTWVVDSRLITSQLHRIDRLHNTELGVRGPDLGVQGPDLGVRAGCIAPAPQATPVVRNLVHQYHAPPAATCQPPRPRLRPYPTHRFYSQSAPAVPGSSERFSSSNYGQNQTRLRTSGPQNDVMLRSSGTPEKPHASHAAFRETRIDQSRLSEMLTIGISCLISVISLTSCCSTRRRRALTAAAGA
ncbi:LOW QUALITY PROTEIN: hypothetical protein CRUP_026294 [Coryphaenoides rupestris]|nr:LOW QUALITY PROTEIN: hypothetical protein CRUP_026294 [Coryphaenoides rupestris]